MNRHIIDTINVLCPKHRVVLSTFTIVWMRIRRSHRRRGAGERFCRTTVETRGGEIVFHTEAGKGITFRVTVPMFEKTDD